MHFRDGGRCVLYVLYRRVITGVLSCAYCLESDEIAAAVDLQDLRGGGRRGGEGLGIFCYVFFLFSFAHDCGSLVGRITRSVMRPPGVEGVYASSSKIAWSTLEPPRPRPGGFWIGFHGDAGVYLALPSRTTGGGSERFTGCLYFFVFLSCVVGVCSGCLMEMMLLPNADIVIAFFVSFGSNASFPP